MFAEDRGAGVRPAFLAAVGAVQWVFGGCGGWSYRPGFGYRCERPIQLVEVMGLACVAYRTRRHVRQSRAGERLPQRPDGRVQVLAALEPRVERAGPVSSGPLPCATWRPPSCVGVASRSSVRTSCFPSLSRRAPACFRVGLLACVIWGCRPGRRACIRPGCRGAASLGARPRRGRFRGGLRPC